MTVDTHRLRSSAEKVARTLRVYAPKTRARLPAVYFHDGQNVFDAASDVAPSWGVDTALDAWVAGGGAPWIAVGIDHRGKERIADDSPWKEKSAGTPARGAAYATFVAEAVTAFVDARYRIVVSPHARAIVGSSLRGLMVLYVGAKYTHVLGRVGAFSPSTMWAGLKLFSMLDRKTARPHRVYVDVGANEYFENGETVLDYGREVPRFVDHLRALGHDATVLRFVADPEGEHREADWRRRASQRPCRFFSADVRTNVPASRARCRRVAARARRSRAATDRLALRRASARARSLREARLRPRCEGGTSCRPCWSRTRPAQEPVLVVRVEAMEAPVSKYQVRDGAMHVVVVVHRGT